MLVSIVMPTYNCGKYILHSIDSVLAQTLTDWELLIEDDGSVDNTYDLLKPYLEKYPNIHYHCLSEHSGPSVPRTVAIRHSVGKYVAFLDSDDVWAPHKLEHQVAFMEKTGALMSATAYRLMDEAGNPLPTVCYPPEKMDYNSCIRHSNPVGNLTIMYNQEQLGKFEVPNIAKRNDFALWLKILHKTQYCYGLQENLASYRVGRKDSVSTHKLALAKYHWQLYHDIEGHSLLQSTLEMGCWAFVKGTDIGLDKRQEEV